ncbi:TPA: hypothetical protein HGT63_22330 [Escherichia coli]|nr:hypothetical protein [Escherichia coli]
MTSSPLRVAIIGAGQVADKVHASYYCTRNDLELVAVCDSRLSQAQALAEKYGNASVWDDPQAMLLAVKPDVVSVCSPNRFHYEHIHAAATGAIWLGAIQGFAGVSVRDGELHLNPALPEQWQQLSFPLFWQGCELQVTLDAQRIAIRTSAPVSLCLNGQLISVAEESVFCLGDFILPFNGTATTHQEDE